MARPAKTKVDYFPHVTHCGKTIAILEARWGNDGYAFWFKLLELLGDSNDFAFNCNQAADWEYLLSRTRVTEPVARAILDKLAEVEAIDADCWANKIVWSDNFVKNLESVFLKRKQELPHKPGFSPQKFATESIPGDFCDGNSTEPTIIPTETDKVNQSKSEKSIPKRNISEQTKTESSIETQTESGPICPSAQRPGVEKQADTVFLTPDELGRLRSEYGCDGADRLITILDGYKTNNSDKGNQYVDDYKAIRSWVVPRYRKELSEQKLSRRDGPVGSVKPTNNFIDKLAELAVEGGR